MAKTNKLLNVRSSLTTMIILLLILSACTRDLIYFPKSIQEELEKAVEGVYEGIIVCVNESGETSLYSAGWNNIKRFLLIH